MTQTSRPNIALPGAKARLLSTTEGRQRFPDLLQTCYGDKAVIGFDRYGRALGAVVPMEAVRLLAGFGDTVSPHVRDTIAATATALIRQLPAEAEMCGMSDFDLEDGAVEAGDLLANPKP